jgi:hypothetical protein
LLSLLLLLPLPLSPPSLSRRHCSDVVAFASATAVFGVFVVSIIVVIVAVNCHRVGVDT